jgi:hypothetical protein
MEFTEMTVALYQSAREILHTSRTKVIVGTGAGDQQIAELGGLRDCKLPPSYRAMLSDCGFLRFRGKMISGIGLDGVVGSSFGNVYFATMKSRTCGVISDRMIWVMSTGYGPDYVLDCSQPSDIGECPVFLVSEQGYAAGYEREADSFGAFLLDQVLSATS